MDRWSIYWVTKFPESYLCWKCKKHNSPQMINCIYCNNALPFTSIVGKIRPVILWTPQTKWWKSMAFGIPLSATNPERTEIYSIPIRIGEYAHIATDSEEKPRIALISQATRIDASAIVADRIIGKVTNEVVKARIEDELFKWIFE